MPKINDPSLNQKILRYVEDHRHDVQDLDRLNQGLSELNENLVHGSHLQVPSVLHSARKIRSVSPMKVNSSAYSSVQNQGFPEHASQRSPSKYAVQHPYGDTSDLPQYAKMKIDELEKDNKRKESMIESLNARIQMLTAQGERNVDELMNELKQVKSRNINLEMEVKGKNDMIQRMEVGERLMRSPNRDGGAQTGQTRTARESSKENNPNISARLAAPVGVAHALSGSISGMTPTTTMTTGVLDSLKQKLESLVKKINVLGAELQKIYLSLGNCVIIVEDWRHLSRAEESDKLRIISQKAEKASDLSKVTFTAEANKIKDECLEVTLSWTRHIQSLIGRLEVISKECKADITRKATELIAIKNEMDHYDPSKRIPLSMMSYNSRSSPPRGGAN
jgi:hypothetical protein